MTHFNVAVITKYEDEDIEPILAPYDENTEDDEWVEFDDRTQEVVAGWEVSTIPYVVTPSGEEKRLYGYLREEQRRIESLVDSGAEGWRIKDVGVKKLYDSIEEYAEGYCGYNVYPDEETGEARFGYYCNPNGYWDYWMPIEKAFKVDGETVEMCKCKDVEDGMWMDAEKAGELYDRLEDDSAEVIERLSYMSEFEAAETKEEFVAARIAFCTYAVVTPDGEWHQPGRMGWFGMSTESGEDANKWATSYRERFLEAYPEHFIRLVDCHI